MKPDIRNILSNHGVIWPLIPTASQCKEGSYTPSNHGRSTRGDYGAYSIGSPAVLSTEDIPSMRAPEPAVIDFGGDGTLDLLGELPHANALHDQRLIRSPSPQWSIKTLRSADNIPPALGSAVTMDAEDSPWGGASHVSRCQDIRANSGNMIRRTVKVKPQCTEY